MASYISPLVQPEDIVLDKVVVIDARSGPDANQRYKAGHVKGALHADLDADLSQKPENAAIGGRHPLPDIQVFAQFVGSLGIRPESSVIVYDDKSGANAACRFWWMLRSLGHFDVRVVDGGLDAMITAGIPISADVEKVAVADPYPANEWILPTVSIGEVQAAAQDDNAVVVDVRESYRYRGEREPIDLVAGHIPGAINKPYIENLGSDGRYRSPEELKLLYKDVLEQPNVIVHCGSGVTACHTILALEHAGFRDAKLYVGSWSEWSRRDLPIAKEN